MPISNNNNFIREAYKQIIEKTKLFQESYQNVATLTKKLISEKSISAETAIQKTTIQPNHQLKKLGDKLPKALSFIPVIIAARLLIKGCLLIAKSNLFLNQASQKSQSETEDTASTSSAKPRENLNFTPQIIQKANGEYIVIKPADKTTFLVLQGGGVKGMAYPSFLKALNENAPFIADLKDVAGASAGSMMAFLISSGVDLNTIDDYVNKANPFQQMLGSIDDLMMGKGFFSAGNLAKGLKEMSQKAASSYCEEKNWDTIEQKLTDRGVDKTAIAKFKLHVETGFKEGVTFSDLDLLHRLEPAQFKRFHATGYEKHTKETIYFNAQNFPDMYCHDAVRISMAIPTVVRPIILEGRKFSDGGQGSNLPTEALEKAGQKAEGRTLALVFSNSGRTHLAQATPM
ncbi:MAG: patatin-like phospholipase family protein, partial [Bacteriovorax sp.]